MHTAVACEHKTGLLLVTVPRDAVQANQRLCVLQGQLYNKPSFRMNAKYTTVLYTKNLGSEQT